MFNIKYCQWLNLNLGLLELEATTPTNWATTTATDADFFSDIYPSQKWSRQVVVAKAHWILSVPTILRPQVQIPSTPSTLLSIYAWIVGWEKNENNVQFIKEKVISSEKSLKLKQRRWYFIWLARDGRWNFNNKKCSSTSKLVRLKASNILISILLNVSAYLLQNTNRWQCFRGYYVGTLKN